MSVMLQCVHLLLLGVSESVMFQCVHLLLLGVSESVMLQCVHLLLLGVSESVMLQCVHLLLLGVSESVMLQCVHLLLLGVQYKGTGLVNVGADDGALVLPLQVGHLQGVCAGVQPVNLIGHPINGQVHRLLQVGNLENDLS